MIQLLVKVLFVLDRLYATVLDLYVTIMLDDKATYWARLLLLLSITFLLLDA